MYRSRVCRYPVVVVDAEGGAQRREVREVIEWDRIPCSEIYVFQKMGSARYSKECEGQQSPGGRATSDGTVRVKDDRQAGCRVDDAVASFVIPAHFVLLVIVLVYSTSMRLESQDDNG